MKTLKESILGSMGMGDKMVSQQNAVEKMKTIISILEKLNKQHITISKDISYDKDLCYYCEDSIKGRQKVKKHVESIYNELQKKFKDDKYVSMDRQDNDGVIRLFFTENDFRNDHNTITTFTTRFFVDNSYEKQDSSYIMYNFWIMNRYKSVTEPLFKEIMKDYIK